MAKTTPRKSLSQSGLLQAMRKEFESTADSKKASKIPVVDHLVSDLAIFSLKYLSLLKFDNSRNNEIVLHNLQTLYGIQQAPRDTYLYEHLDEIESRHLSKAFTKVFSLLQRGKGLEGFTYLDGCYLLSEGGTGCFSSDQVHFQNCCATLSGRAKT